MEFDILVGIRCFHDLFCFLNLRPQSYPALHLLDHLILLDQSQMALGESLFFLLPLTTIFFFFFPFFF
jgi:hypothetical protein